MKRKCIIFLLVTLFSLTVACNFPALLKQANNTDHQYIAYEFSSDQLAVMQKNGNPTRFTIIFNNDKRQETWFYDTSGYTYAFINGALIAKKEFSPQYQENMYATTYLPDHFSRGMGADEILASTGKTDFTITAVEGLGRDAHLLHMEGLSIGLVEGKINFVETYPALTENKLEPSDFVESADYIPTTEEIANAGLHTFLIVTYVDNEFIEEKKGHIEVSFEPDGVHFLDDGIATIYERVEPNVYTDADDILRLTFILDGYIWYEKSVNGSAEVEILHSRLD